MVIFCEWLNGRQAVFGWAAQNGGFVLSVCIS